MESVAGFAWNQWQLCRGMAGSFRVESVAGFAWNRWQLSRGIRTLRASARQTRALGEGFPGWEVTRARGTLGSAGWRSGWVMSESMEMLGEIKKIK
jgi:hypothetical protein